MKTDYRKTEKKYQKNTLNKDVSLTCCHLRGILYHIKNNEFIKLFIIESLIYRKNRTLPLENRGYVPFCISHPDQLQTNGLEINSGFFFQIPFKTFVGVIEEFSKERLPKGWVE